MKLSVNSIFLITAGIIAGLTAYLLFNRKCRSF